MSRSPVVLVPACNRWLGDHPFHIAGRKYVDFVRLAGALPLVVPRLDLQEIDEALDLADGVLLTGSPSNVHPSAFGEEVHDPSLPLDPERDAWTLPLITRALARGVPIEVEVVPGGALQAIVGRPRFEVNSLHGQAVKALAHGLRVEAVAPDGLVEAFSVPGAAGFNLCVQWHPEWQAAHNPVSMQLVQAFGAAVRQYHDQYRDRVRGPLPSAAAPV